MFSILAGFCYLFCERAKEKGHSEAKLRIKIYIFCGSVIGALMAAMAIHGVINELSDFPIDRLVFYGEKYSLIAFGVAWITASLTLPFITSKDERVHLFTRKKTDNEG